MKQNASSRRVNEQARQTIAEIFMFEVSDPRLADITIMGCEVSFDRSFCNVFYTADPTQYEAVAAALKRAAGKVRYEMARKLSWRVAPELRFVLDNTVDEAERITRMLAAEENRTTSASAEDKDDAITAQSAICVPEGEQGKTATAREGAQNEGAQDEGAQDEGAQGGDDIS